MILRHTTTNSCLGLSGCNARALMRGGPGTAARKRNWTPLVLRWRKRRAIRQGRPAGSFVSSTNVASFPQFNFYFTQFFTQRGRSVASSKSGLPLRILDMQTIRSYKSPDLVRATPRLSEASGYRRRRPAGHRIEERANTRAGMQSESRYSAQTDATAIVRSFLRCESTLFYRPGAGRKRLLPNAGETRTTRPTLTSPEFVFAGRSRSRGNRRPTPAARTRAETSNAALSAREATLRPPLSYQGEELVWRRVTRSLADHDERTHRGTSVDQPVRTDLRTPRSRKLRAIFRLRPPGPPRPPAGR